MTDSVMQRALAWLRGGSAGQDDAGGPAPKDEPQPGQPIALPVEAIRPNRFQPRQDFDPDELGSLAASIRQVGVLQPIVVRPVDDGFEIIMGERRWRAAMVAGLQEIPALVQAVDDEKAAVLALVENVQRADLSFWEEAEGYQKILDRFGITQEELAAAVGRSQSTIANKLRLLRLPEAVKEKARRAALTERHVRALLKVEDPQLMGELLDLMVAGNLTVRDAEALVADALAAAAQQPASSPTAKSRGKGGGLRVIKDVRIMMNTFRQGVDALRRAGLDARMDTEDHGEHITITIRIPKGRPNS
ncbi:MAG TPA: ParB/RepB/Spo0J family partition protein [Sphingobacteriaceae bacterium]|nr:ParB/RepB/Spo0J family partition protein [Sphingobacteriaceae bacterium]